jgi:Protein kinase domain
MGEVYKAKDTRLDRTVAVKVLPSHVSSDPVLRERFEREARTIAALNHPHICTLHDVGQQDGIDFLVLEHLEGQTLADRLAKGALLLDQRSLPIAIHKETIGATWNREDQIVKQDPDLVVIHRGAFAHAMVLEFQLGYSVPSSLSAPSSATSGPPPSVETLYDRLSPISIDKLEAFIGYVGGANPRTQFLVYSRDWLAYSSDRTDETGVAWGQSLVRRFPALRDRVSTVHVANRDGTASFREVYSGDMGGTLFRRHG